MNKAENNSIFLEFCVTKYNGLVETARDVKKLLQIVSNIRLTLKKSKSDNDAYINYTKEQSRFRVNENRRKLDLQLDRDISITKNNKVINEYTRKK